MRILYFGMQGLFSKEPLQRLLAEGFDICAIVVPSDGTHSRSQPRLLPPPAVPQSDLPLISPYFEATIVQLGWQAQIPVWQVGRLNKPTTLQWLAEFKADIICVVCFPIIFPPALLALPPLGCLNLHPSLLPDYRGPTPLFWICRNGESQSGVTVHFLAEQVDAGDIVAQTQFDVPVTTTEVELNRLSAQHGARLLVNTLRQADHLNALRKPQAEGRYFPAPTAADCLIPTTWPAERAFRFLRGAASWPLRLKTNGAEIKVGTVLAYEPDGLLPIDVQAVEDELWVQFTPGIVKLRGTYKGVPTPPEHEAPRSGVNGPT